MGTAFKNSGIRELSIVLDASSTMAMEMDGGTRCSAVIEASIRSLRYLAEHDPSCIASVGTFTDHFTLCMSPMSVGPNLWQFEQAITQIPAGGWTFFRPALEGAAGLLGIRSPQNPAAFLGRLIGKLRARRSPDEDPYLAVGNSQRSLIFLSDGQNNGPNPLPVAEDIKRAGVCIHTIGVASTPQEVDSDLLMKIASWDAANGRPHYTFIKDSQILVQCFVNIARGLMI